MTIKQLKEKLDFILQEGYVTENHNVLFGLQEKDGIRIVFVNTISAPGLVLSQEENYSFGDLYFTKQNPISINEDELTFSLKPCLPHSKYVIDH